MYQPRSGYRATGGECQLVHPEVSSWYSRRDLVTLTAMNESGKCEAGLHAPLAPRWAEVASIPLLGKGEAVRAGLRGCDKLLSLTLHSGVTRWRQLRRLLTGRSIVDHRTSRIGTGGLYNNGLMSKGAAKGGDRQDEGDLCMAVFVFCSIIVCVH